VGGGFFKSPTEVNRPSYLLMLVNQWPKVCGSICLELQCTFYRTFLGMDIYSFVNYS